MAIKDVTNLRREGKLKEALDLAVQEHNEDPNAWTKMSLFWVYRDMALNLYLPANNIDDAKECLNKMQGLLPEMMDDNGAGEKAYQNLFKRILPNADSIRSAYELSKTDPNAAYNDVTSKFGRSGKDIDEALHEEFGWIIYRYIGCPESRSKFSSLCGAI
jgi:tetratricopeptide (TPR) repeat protein